MEYKFPNVEPNSNVNSKTLMTFRVKKGIVLKPGDTVTAENHKWEIVEPFAETHPSFKHGYHQVCCKVTVMEPNDEAQTSSSLTNPIHNETN